MDVLVFVLAIAIAIIVGTKLKTNIGVVAMAMAFIAGGFYYGLKPNDVLACFPTNIFFYMFFGTFFYGFGMHNGTFQNIAQKILHKFGKNAKIIPIVMYFAMACVMALGAGSNAGPAFMSPIFFGIVTELGLHPVVAALACFSAATAFNLLPWTSDFAQKTSINIGTFGEETARTISLTAMAYDIIFLLACFIVLCIITGAFKGGQLKEFPEAPKMTKEQKATLIVIACLGILLVVPMIINMFHKNPVTTWMGNFLDFRCLAAIGIVVLYMLKIGDINEVLKKSVPWVPIITVCGTGTLVGLAAKIGIADTIGAWLGSSVPAAIVEPVFMLICGGLSLVVSGAVVQPLMVSLIPGIAMATGCNAMSLAVCMMVGLQYAGFSPFSAGGTMATIGCTDEEERKKLIAPMILCAIAFVVVTAILAGLGLFDAIFANAQYTLTVAAPK